MSDIERFVTIWGGGGMMPANNGNYVRYDDHRAEVERVIADVVKLRIDLNSAQVASNQRRGEVERLTAKRDAAQAEVERLKNAIDHLTSERDEARGEVERVTARQTEMETHISGLTAELHRTRADGIELRWVEGEVQQLTAQRDAAQAEVARLKEQVGALTVAVEQADEMKAHAEASAAWEEAQTDRVRADLDAAQADVERLTQELDGRRATNQRIIAERDLAQGERERLQDLLRCERQELSTLREALRVRRRDQPAQNLDMANGQAILDSSRPDDETIWREAFMAAVHDVHKNWMDVADVALAQYRKRWPR